MNCDGVNGPKIFRDDFKKRKHFQFWVIFLTVYLLAILSGYIIICICYPVNTRRYLDVHSTFIERYERQMDVGTTLCAYWVEKVTKFTKIK